jgi:hypothetical protein
MDVPQVNDRPVLQAFQAEREAQSGMFVPQDIEAQNQAAYAQDQNRAFASAAGLVKGIGAMWAQGQMEAAKVASYTAAQKLSDQWMSDAASGKIQPSVADDGTVTVKPTDEWTAMRDSYLSQAKDKYQAPGAQSFLQSSILENANRVQTDGLRAVYDKYQKDYNANASLGLQMTTDALAKGNSFVPETDDQGRTVDYKKLDLSAETDIIRHKVMDIKGLDGPAQNILIQQQKNTVFAGMVDKEAQRLAAIDPAQAKSFIEAANDKYRPDDVTKLDDQALKQLLDKSSVIEQATKEKITNDADTMIQQIQQKSNAGYGDAFDQLIKANAQKYPGFKDQNDKLAESFAKASADKAWNQIIQDVATQDEARLKRDYDFLIADPTHDFSGKNDAFALEKKSLIDFTENQLGKDAEADAAAARARATAAENKLWSVIDQTATPGNYDGIQSLIHRMRTTDYPDVPGATKNTMIKSLEESSKAPDPNIENTLDRYENACKSGALPWASFTDYLNGQTNRNLHNPADAKLIDDAYDRISSYLTGSAKDSFDVIKDTALNLVQKGAKNLEAIAKDPDKVSRFSTLAGYMHESVADLLSANKDMKPMEAEGIVTKAVSKMLASGVIKWNSDYKGLDAGWEDQELAKYHQLHALGESEVSLDKNGRPQYLGTSEKQAQDMVAHDQTRIEQAVKGVKIIGNDLETDSQGHSTSGDTVFKDDKGVQYKVTSSDGKTTAVEKKVGNQWVTVPEVSKTNQDKALGKTIATATENQDINRILTKEQNDRKQTEYQANQEVAANVMSDPSKFDAAYKAWDGKGKIADYLMKWEKAH